MRNEWSGPSLIFSRFWIVLLLGVGMLRRAIGLGQPHPPTIDRAEKLAKRLDVVWFVGLEEPALPEACFGGLIDRWDVACCPQWVLRLGCRAAPFGRRTATARMLQFPR